jgi:mono/diheme cytochrome c family protein
VPGDEKLNLQLFNGRYHRGKSLIRVLAVVLIVFPGANAVADGEELYVRCAACHLPDGAGIPGIFPPLKNRLGPIATTESGRDYLVMTLICGLIGDIVVDGITYRGVMPAQPLSDADIASILNFVGTALAADQSNAWQIFSEEDVAGIRQRYPNWNGQASMKLRQEVPVLREAK